MSELTEGGARVKINKRIIDPVMKRPERIITLYGGSASGKTTNMLIYMLGELLGEKDKEWNGAIVRRYYPELKKGLWKDAKKYLDAWGLTKRIKINEAELTMTRGKRCLNFMNAQNEERFKGLEFNLIFIDEVNQLNEETFMEIINRSGRAKGSSTRIVTAFNPVSALHWCYQKLVLEPIPNSCSIKLTYHDNIKNLSQTYIDYLESLKDTCPRRYMIYTLGEAGTPEGLIYDPERWDMPDKMPQIAHWDAFGLDFGYQHAMSIIAVKKMEDGSYYVHQCYYKTEQTVSDLIEWLHKTERLYHFQDYSTPIYCDSARADMIEELKREGFNARKSNKSVDDGIAFCQGLRLHLTPYSKDLRGELENYSWQQNRETGAYDDKPVKAYDDAVDAMRYALFTHFSKGRGKKVENILITSPSYDDMTEDEEFEWC